MQHIRTLDIQLHNTPAWLTIGAYDGIHLGHQALIHDLVSQAHKSHEQAVVVSLFPHPALILGRTQPPFYLTSPDDRAEFLGKMGVDVLFTYPFTREVSNLGPQQFLQTLVDRMTIRQLWVGDDFALGKDRQGSLEVLGELGNIFGYTLHIFKQVQVGDTFVSSSFIRERLGAGDLQMVKKMLGRNYSARGILSSPSEKTTKPAHSFFLQTWDEQLLPPAGSYSCVLWLNGIEFSCVATLTSLKNHKNPLIKLKMLNLDRPLSYEPANLEFLQAISQ
jgi:riboflavin kinase/FMN adenylyltransferase